MTNPSLLKDRNYIFFLSHIRGYTTLLSHILGSHPEISGYAETWNSYRGTLDLLKLRCAVCSHGNYKPNGTYFLDKILHNHLQISDSVISRTSTRYIFMIRRPVPTLKSMVAFHRKYLKEGGATKGCTLPSTVEDAVLHYTKRITFLADTGVRLRRLGKRALVIRAEDLINYPQAVLSELQRFLSLRSSLDEHYSLFDHTGAWNFGDTSVFVGKGKIQKERPSHADIIIADELAGRANHEYERCLAALTNSFQLATAGKAIIAGCQ